MSSPLAERTRRWLRRGFSTCLIALSSVTPGAAKEPETSVRVLLVSNALNEPLFARVAAELAAQGFAVVTEHMPSGEPTLKLSGLALRAAADAAIEIQVAAGKIHINIIDLIHDQVLSASLDAGGRTESARAVAALRTVELVRTNLIDLLALTSPRFEPAPPPDRYQPQRKLETVAPAPPAHPIASWAFGPAASQSPPGSGVSWHALFAFRFLFARELSVEALVLAPLSPATISGREGSADLWFAFVGAGAGWQSTFWSGSIASVGAGVGGLLLRAVGHPNPGYEGHDDYVLSFSPYLRLGLGQALTPRLVIRGDLMAAAAVPRTALFFDERRASNWGRPWLAACASVQWQVW